MTKPMVRFVDLDTNKVIDTEMTNTEFVEYQADQAKYDADKVEAEAKASAKSALLAKLGITEDEAKLLLS